MITTVELAKLYKVDESTIWRAISGYKTRLDKMASYYVYRNKKIKRQGFNARQLTFIITKALQDPPEGYILKNGTLIPFND